MRHPFDGVIAEADGRASAESSPGRASRRSFLSALAAALGGLGLLAGGREASARSVLQKPNPGGASVPPPRSGWNRPRPGPGRVTTYALGEEGGPPAPRQPRRPPEATTLALGEEGGPPRVW
jgi:hypothetical protein